MLGKTEKAFKDFIHDLRSDATKGNYARTLDQFIAWTQTLEKKNQFKSYSALSIPEYLIQNQLYNDLHQNFLPQIPEFVSKHHPTIHHKQSGMGVIT